MAVSRSACCSTCKAGDPFFSRPIPEQNHSALRDISIWIRSHSPSVPAVQENDSHGYTNFDPYIFWN